MRPPPSWRRKAAEIVGQTGCTHTAHGTVGGALVGAPGAFGTTRLCRPTLPGRRLSSALAHSAGQRSGGPAALTRPMERSGGPWLGLRERLAPPGFAPPPSGMPTSALHNWPSRRPESKQFSPHLQRQWYCELAIVEIRQGAGIARWQAWNMVLFWLLRVKSVHKMH